MITSPQRTAAHLKGPISSSVRPERLCQAPNQLCVQAVGNVLHTFATGEASQVFAQNEPDVLFDVTSILPVLHRLKRALLLQLREPFALMDDEAAMSYMSAKV